jgi:hypothetical protein
MGMDSTGLAGGSQVSGRPITWRLAKDPHLASDERAATIEDACTRRGDSQKQKGSESSACAVQCRSWPDGAPCDEARQSLLHIHR